MPARLTPLILSALLLQSCWHSSEVEPELCASLFADIPPTAPVVYVLAEAIAGGDGSLEHPFRTVTEGLSAARPGDVVAVGEGTYDEAVTIPSGITLVGACSGGTILTSTAPAASPSEGVVTIGGEDVEVRNVTITSATRSGLVAVGEGRAARVSDFRVHDSICGVSFSEGGELDLVDGYIEQNVIGACIGCDMDYDLARILEDDIIFVRNEINLDRFGGCP